MDWLTAIRVICMEINVQVGCQLASHGRRGLELPVSRLIRLKVAASRGLGIDG